MTTATVVATDTAGNTATATVSYIVTQPSSRTLYGSSYGDSVTWTVQNLSPRLVRTYNSSQRDSVPTGQPQFYSRKPGDVERAALANRDAATIATLIADFKKIPDLPFPGGLPVGYDHERDNADTTNPTRLAASFVAGWAVLLSDVIPAVNAARTNPLVGVPIWTGAIFTRGIATVVMDAWAVPGAQLWGWDIYASPRIPDCAAYAQAKGKAWCVPEWGASVNTDQTDAQILTRMQANVPTFAGFANPPSMVLWFNANHNNLKVCPPSGGVATQSVAYLKGLCTS